MTDTPLDDREDLLEEIAEQLSERARRGEAVELDDLISRHPDLEADIRTLHRSIAVMEGLKRKRLSSSGGTGGTMPDLDRLGDYRLIREIGRGGMGIVYEAEQESLARRVAIKVLPPSVFLDRAQIERFHKEAETASRLHHENIVPIHAVGNEGGVHYYAMQLIDGVSLDAVIRLLANRDGPPPRDEELRRDVATEFAPTGDRAAIDWKAVARVGIQTAEALVRAHEDNVLHRDIKPSNLLLERGGKVWVTDFGIAKLLDQKTVTQTGDFIGTLEYSPPEHLDGAMDARGDVYSLGLTLHEFVTFERAFSGSTKREILQQIKDGALPSPRRVNPAIPKDLTTIITKATAYDPSHRYPSARAMAEDLRRFAADVPILARNIGSLERAWRWSRRNRVTASLAATTLIALIVAAVVGWSGYLTTTAALSEVRNAKDEAEDRYHEAQRATAEARRAGEEATRATARAESNLGVALEAFEAFFAMIADRADSIRGADEALPEVPIMRAVSEREIALLNHLTKVYDHFAEANEGDARLREERARALRRLGDIRRWTGSMDEARIAYEEALEVYESLRREQPDKSFATECAFIHQSLGLVQSTRGQGMSAFMHMSEAVKVLQQVVAKAPTPRHRYDLVRGLNSLGMFESRLLGDTAQRIPRIPFLGVAGKPPRQSALEIAEQLATEEPNEAAYLLLLARSQRLIAQDAIARGETATTAKHLGAAIERLSSLVSAHPDRPEYANELAEASLLRGRNHADLAQAVRLCRDAVHHAQKLLHDNEDVPLYLDLVGRTRRHLGEALVRRGLTEEAIRHISASIEVRSALVARFPAAISHLVELCRARASLAKAQLRGGRTVEARGLLESIIVDARASLQADRLRRFPLRFVLPDLYEQLASVLDELGEADEAAAARRLARRRGVLGGFDRPAGR